MGSTALGERLDPGDFTTVPPNSSTAWGAARTLELKGKARESVGKALQQMRALGWVRTGRRRIAVVDLAALRERATL